MQFTIEDEWAVLVKNSLENDVLVRDITFFRRTDGLYRRGEEQHQLQLIDPDWVALQLQSAGFAVQRLSAYGPVKMPLGLEGFAAIKEHGCPSDTTPE